MNRQRYNKPHNYQGNNERMDRDRPKQSSNGPSGPSLSPNASSNSSISNGNTSSSSISNRDGAKFSGGSSRRDADGFTRSVLWAML